MNNGTKKRTKKRSKMDICVTDRPGDRRSDRKNRNTRQETEEKTMKRYVVAITSMRKEETKIGFAEATNERNAIELAFPNDDYSWLPEEFDICEQLISDLEQIIKVVEVPQ
jgi:hypothetical protein